MFIVLHGTKKMQGKLPQLEEMEHGVLKINLLLYLLYFSSYCFIFLITFKLRGYTSQAKKLTQ